MNRRHELLRRLILIFIGCIVINIGAAQVYTLQAKPKSGSSRSRSSSKRSSTKRSSSKVSSGSFSNKSKSSSKSSSSKSSSTSNKVNSGSFSSKKDTTNTNNSSTQNKVNSGSFSTSKPKASSNTTTINNTGRYSTSYGNTGLNIPGSIFSRSLFGSWYYRMPVIRYISPITLIVVLLLIGLFIGYWYWKRHL